MGLRSWLGWDLHLLLRCWVLCACAFCGWLCACVLVLPSIPGEGGSCDVRSFNPETAAAAEATDPRGCRWWSPQASEGKGRDPEAEAHRSLGSGEWSLLSRRSRLGGSVGGLLGWGIGCRAVRLSLPTSRSSPLPALGTQAQQPQDLLRVSVLSIERHFYPGKPGFLGVYVHYPTLGPNFHLTFQSLLHSILPCRGASQLPPPQNSINLLCLLRSGSLEHFRTTPLSQKQTCPCLWKQSRVGVPESKKCITSSHLFSLAKPF